jgi:sulfite exporter TauE/SafE
MDLALLFSALALALAGVPHCTAMCAAPCAAAVGGPAQGQGARMWAFHGARILAYAAAGAVAASSVGALARLAEWSPVLRPLWTLLHALALALGLWLLWHGRQPAWLESLGRGSHRAAAPAAGWQRVKGPIRSGVAGSLWVAWPCGLLQSALLLAALANGAAAGALVMGGFAVVTATGLVLGPGLWAWLGGGAVAARAAVWGVRLAGASLVAASGWALSHGLWQRVAAYCVT